MAQEDIAVENAGWLHLRATPRVAKAFSELNLFVNNQNEIPVNSDALRRGRNLSAMGERHPIEEATSSSISYCYFPHFKKAQFVRAHERLLGGAFPPKLPAIQTGPLPRLEHDVWIGQQVILQRGVTLHTGCVVGAVVPKDAPAYAIVAGNPARPIRKRFSAELCQRLLATQWWNYRPKALFEFERAEPVRFCLRMEAALAEGSLEPLPAPNCSRPTKKAASRPPSELQPNPDQRE